MGMCPVAGCGEHDTVEAGLSHGLREVIKEQRRQHRTLQQIQEGYAAMATTIQQLADDLTQYVADVTAYKDANAAANAATAAALADLQTKLDAALASQGGVPTDVQDGMDALDVAVKAADATILAPPAPPVVAPTAA